MVDSYKFGNMKSEMIWDRHTQSTAFWTAPDGTWIETGKGREAYLPKNSNLAAATEDESPTSNKAQLESMSRGPWIPHPNRKPTKQRDKSWSGQRAKANRCRRCGEGSHPIQQCPACDAQCPKCKKKDITHLSACLNSCRSDYANGHIDYCCSWRIWSSWWHLWPWYCFSKHNKWRFQRSWHLMVCDNNNSKYTDLL